MGSDGSGKVKFKAFLLQVFSDGNTGDFGSLIRVFFLGFEADIGIVEYIKNVSFFFALSAHYKSELIFNQFSFSSEVNGFTYS